MGRLNTLKCPSTKKGTDVSSLYVPPKKGRLEGPNQNRQSLLLKGPTPNLPPPSISITGARKKGNGIDFDVSAEQPVQRGMAARSAVYLGRASVLYEEFLIGGLSQRIEEDKGLDLRHTLVRHALMIACLAHKNMLEYEENDTVRRELRDELIKVNKELTVGVGREKQLVADLEEARAHEKALEMELKE
ncbi:hypothetical protein ACOSP7_007512 [Xanthoceras sorbifolium]